MRERAADDPRIRSLPDSHISTGGAFSSLAWLSLAGWGRACPRARRRACECLSSRRERDSRLPPLRETKREAGRRAPNGEPSRTPSTKAHRQILDFQKNTSLMIWSPERWFIPPWSLLFASPIATRTPTAVDPRTAIRGHARELHTLYMILAL